MEELFAGPLGPVVIFLLRILDVSLATLRMLLIMRGMKSIAPVVGFFEVLIWVVAAGTAIRFLDSPLHLVGYAGGFAAGTIVGLSLEEKLAFGQGVVRIMSRHSSVRIAAALRDAGFGITEFEGRGREGPVEMVYAVLRRRHVPVVLERVHALDPDAFVTVEEPRAILRGWLFSHRRK